MISHLLFMRHANAEWGAEWGAESSNEDQPDHQRRLSPLGHKEADAAARALTARDYAPDLIWASDAARTQETARRLIQIIPGAQTIIKVPEFYHASAAQVLKQCAGAQEPDGKLMLLGHNPGWSELAFHFCGLAETLPTAACLVFVRQSQDYDWFSPRSWRLIDRVIAQELLP